MYSIEANILTIVDLFQVLVNEIVIFAAIIVTMYILFYFLIVIVIYCIDTFS